MCIPNQNQDQLSKSIDGQLSDQDIAAAKAKAREAQATVAAGESEKPIQPAAKQPGPAMPKARAPVEPKQVPEAAAKPAPVKSAGGGDLVVPK